MNKIGIRLANSDDALSIERLEKQMDHEVYSLNMIKDSLVDKNYYNIVAVVDDVVVAYLSAMNVACESSLLKIIVDNNFKRRGIGSLLMKEYLKYLEGIDCQKVFLEVRKDNDAAIKLSIIPVPNMA